VAMTTRLAFVEAMIKGANSFLRRGGAKPGFWRIWQVYVSLFPIDFVGLAKRRRRRFARQIRR